jgi:hypothetical protein
MFHAGCKLTLPCYIASSASLRFRDKQVTIKTGPLAEFSGALGESQRAPRPAVPRDCTSLFTIPARAGCRLSEKA